MLGQHALHLLPLVQQPLLGCGALLLRRGRLRLRLGRRRRLQGHLRLRGRVRRVRCRRAVLSGRGVRARKGRLRGDALGEGDGRRGRLHLHIGLEQPRLGDGALRLHLTRHLDALGLKHLAHLRALRLEPPRRLACHGHGHLAPRLVPLCEAARVLLRGLRRRPSERHAALRLLRRGDRLRALPLGLGALLLGLGALLLGFEPPRLRERARVAHLLHALRRERLRACRLLLPARVRFLGRPLRVRRRRLRLGRGARHRVLLVLCRRRAGDGGDGRRGRVAHGVLHLLELRRHQAVRLRRRHRGGQAAIPTAGDCRRRRAR